MVSFGCGKKGVIHRETSRIRENIHKMSHKTAKTVTNKFLSTTKSDREGRRTVGSGRVATIIE